MACCTKLKKRVEFFLVVVVLFLFLPRFHCQYYRENSPCSVLYKEANFIGEQYPLTDSGQSVNLPEDPRASDSGWNTTGSVHVEERCTLQICNETYFDGSCQNLDSGDYSSTTGFEIVNITSTSCSCKKECKCSDIFMKRSSCARAYLAGGCSTCNALYTDLHGDKPDFPPDFADKVEALRLRKGCKLTVYSEEGFEGDAVEFEDEIVEDFTGVIESYECICNDELYEPRPPKPRPSSYPSLIEIPDTLDQVITMMSNGGNYTNHPGLRAALKSLRNKRSSKNAYILLLGTTGAGKSSAINLLFDNPSVTKVGHGASTTKDILEFQIPVPVDEIGVANSELRVIDTPGLGDTQGVTSDAVFLATLDSFLSNHQDLSTRKPNVVLVFHKFNDNRFEGEGAGFVKMLRGLDTFRHRITDENYSNVIFVLSHFCSETKATKRKPEKLLAHFKRVIQNYSTFPKPTIITVAENKAKEQDLPMINGYFKLPNNEYYPKNLFDKLELVTQNAGDEMGLGVFRTAFRDSEDFNVSMHRFQMLDQSTSLVNHYLRLLTDAFMGVNQTEVSQLLQHTWDNYIDTQIRREFISSLPYLQKALNMRHINTKADIPKTSTQILELLRYLKHDEATRQLLEKGLNIRAPIFQKNTVAGFSYNVFKDSYLPTSPFSMDDLHHSDIGYMIPKILSCQLDVGSKENFWVFDTKEEYIGHRIQSLGIDGVIPNESFTGVVKPGHNIKEISFRNDSCSITATRELRLFSFDLNDRLDFIPHFKEMIKNLPVFNQTDHENVDKWRNFFNNYGTHVVKSVYGGGAIEIKLESNKPFDNDLAQALFDLIKFAEDLSFLITNNNDSTSSNRTVLREGITHSLKFLGGDTAYHTDDLTKMSVEKAGMLLENWKNSLKFNPTVLETEMRLEPISRLVKKLGQNYSTEIDRATTLLFKSELKYVPPKRSSEPGFSRENTQLMSEVLKMQQDSNQRMTDLIAEIRKADDAREQRRLEMEEKRLVWERERQENEAAYKEKQEQIQQQQNEKMTEMMLQMERSRHEHQAKMAEQQRQHQEHLAKLQEAAANRTAMEMKRLDEERERREKEYERARQEAVEQQRRQDAEYERRRQEDRAQQQRDQQAMLEALEAEKRSSEARRQQQQREYERQLALAREAAERRNRELTQIINRRPPPPSSNSCLKRGTKLLMADKTEKVVESLKVGDMVMDKDFQPTKIIGLSYEFMMHQKFYGFDPNNYFFTDTHIFVGPSLTDDKQRVTLFAENITTLYYHNPLLEYFNVSEMTSNENKVVTLFQLQNGSSVTPTKVQVYEEPIYHPVDTQIYFVEVDSPSGTYFANGYVCRHEVPPAEIWPRTMAIMFRLLNTSIFNKLVQIEYTFNNAVSFLKYTDDVASKVKEYIDTQMELDKQQTGTQFEVMDLADVNFEESISKLFSHPSVSQIGVGLYSKVSVILAPHLDQKNGLFLTNQTVAMLQHKIYNLMKSELEMLIQ